MVQKLPNEFRKYNRNRSQLKNIFKETQRILELINLENFFSEENILDELLPTSTFDRISNKLENCPAIVIFGQDSKSKAFLVNTILSCEILPLVSGNWRWVKIGSGQTNHVNLTLGLEYEVVEGLKSHDEPWTTLSIEDLIESEEPDPNCPTVLDVKLNQPVLKDGVQIFIAPDRGSVPILNKGIFHVLPILLYALGEQPLSSDNIQQLKNLRECYPREPILFVSSLPSVSADNFDIELNFNHYKYEEDISGEEKSSTGIETGPSANKSSILHNTCLNQLISLDFLRIYDRNENYESFWFEQDRLLHLNDLIISNKNLDRILYFVRDCLNKFLVEVSNCLNTIHKNSLKKFILSAFDMAREIQITPKRIQYAQQKESELYSNLMKVVSANQDELTELIQKSIQEMKDEITQASSDSDLYGQALFENPDKGEHPLKMQLNIKEVQKLVLTRLGEKVAKELVQSIKCLQDTFVGTLQRCLLSLEKSYENETSQLASDSLKQILSAAYNVEIHNSSPSLVHSFLERLKQLFKSISLPWSQIPELNPSWKQKMILDVLNSLSAARLARGISIQFREKVKASHDTFQSALRSLENHYSDRLERTEEQRLAIRKYHAPRLAKLALESTSMSDLVRFGIPHQGKEIGRGQYGVVFACDSWGGAPGPCAVKSVVPPDERHWNDLAMEVYYTRSIPDHERIVKLRGSVIDHSYGGGYGSGAAVLLITDRLCRDLYCGLQSELSWLKRIQIAIDVLEGIRYLHSQGLVHRDIKLKNVLLDMDDRAKLTDLGFCITEAMMSGSIVGTPVHMAPELLSGHYDSSVDIYAFGILFWYICAGQVRFPYAFEQFHNKEQLWTSVKRGIRPERLVTFDDECWNLMEQCWSGKPSQRPLLGAILPVLESIQNKAEKQVYNPHLQQEGKS